MTRKPTSVFMRILGVIAASGLLSAPTAMAETLRGRIVAPNRVSLQYVYETSSNSFALDAEPLFQVKLASLSYSAIPKDKCDALREFLKDHPGMLGEEGLAAFHPAAPLGIQVRFARSPHDKEFALLVQEDLKKQGIPTAQAALPRNATQLGRVSNQLSVRWDDRSLSGKGANSLQARVQAALLKSWDVEETGAGILATAEYPKASVATICDLQEGHLSFSVSYEYRNSFLYFDRGNVQPSSLLAIWQGLNAKAKWIDAIASKSEAMGERDARLVAAGSLLALEILGSAAQGPLLQPVSFMTTFAAVFNTPTVEVSRFFNEASAERLADHLGKRTEFPLNSIRGKKDL